MEKSGGRNPRLRQRLKKPFPFCIIWDWHVNWPLAAVNQVIDRSFVRHPPGLLAFPLRPFGALVNVVMARRAQCRRQVVVSLDAAAFATGPITVRCLDKMAAAAQLAIQAGHQAQQFFAANVGMFGYLHDLFFAPAGHFLGFGFGFTNRTMVSNVMNRCIFPHSYRLDLALFGFRRVSFTVVHVSQTGHFMLQSPFQRTRPTAIQ